MNRHWTNRQSRMLNTRLREAKEACRERAKREPDQYSKDAQLFSALADTFLMLECYHRH